MLTVDFRKNGSKHTVIVREGDVTLFMDDICLSKASERRRFIENVRQRTPEADPDRLEQELLQKADMVLKEPAEEMEPAEPADDLPDLPPSLFDLTPQDRLAHMPLDVRQEAEKMLLAPDLFDRILADIEALGVAGEHGFTGTIYLVGTSRLLRRPLAAIGQGHTASGKTHLIETTAELFPPEAVIHATHITPQALFYLPPGSLKHRFVVAGERSRRQNDESAEATRALRQMLSERKLSKLFVIAGMTVRVVQEGPIAYVETTTLTKICDEDQNRCILLSTNEQPEQTRRVLRRIGKDRQEGNAKSAERERIVLRHHALQRMLESKDIVIPYADRLAEHFPNQRVEARRVFGHLLNMVEAFTLLHQRQRATDAQGRLVATAEDYGLARRLLAKPIARLLGYAVSDAARRMLARMLTFGLGEVFSTTDVVRCEKSLSERAVRNHLVELCEAGCLQRIEAGRGIRPSTWRIMKGWETEERIPALPAPEVICGPTRFRHSDSAQVHEVTIFQTQAGRFADSVPSVPVPQPEAQALPIGESDTMEQVDVSIGETR